MESSGCVDCEMECYFAQRPVIVAKSHASQWEKHSDIPLITMPASHTEALCISHLQAAARCDGRTAPCTAWSASLLWPFPSSLKGVGGRQAKGGGGCT